MTTKETKSVREQVAHLLTYEGAHVNFDSAVKDIPVNLRGNKPQGAVHSPWEILEHLRIALWDILEFTRNPKHVSPEFPKGYWPAEQTPPNESAWDKSVEAFRSDLKAVIDLVMDESTDLFTPLKHGDGQTVLREALVAADHNAYHIGELVVVRRLLGIWNK